MQNYSRAGAAFHFSKNKSSIFHRKKCNSYRHNNSKLSSLFLENSAPFYPPITACAYRAFCALRNFNSNLSRVALSQSQFKFHHGGRESRASPPIISLAVLIKYLVLVPFTPPLFKRLLLCI